MFGALKRKTNGPFSLLHDRHKTKVKQNFTIADSKNILNTKNAYHYSSGHNFGMNNKIFSICVKKVCALILHERLHIDNIFNEQY